MMPQPYAIPAKKKTLTLKRPVNLNDDWIAWMPHNWQSMDFTDTLEKWEQVYHASHNQSIRITKASMQRWRNKIKQFVPGYPTNGLILIKENENEEIIANSNKVENYGIATLPTGWNVALRGIHSNPTIRIIQMDYKNIKMYEVRSGKPILSIDYPLDIKPRYESIRYFIASMMRIYRNDPGPILIRSQIDGIMELDCWLLSNYFTISEYWKIDNESIISWWEQLQQKGYDKVYFNQWANHISENGKNLIQSVTGENSITKAMNCNRAKGLIIPKNEFSYNLSDTTIKQIFRKNLRIMFADIEAPVIIT